MQTTPRLPRAIADTAQAQRPSLAERRREQEAYVLAATQSLMVNQRGDALTIGKLATALHMTPAAIRRHFADIDAILSAILVRHLTAVLQAVRKVPQDDPDRSASRRAAYIAATRTDLGEFNEPHLLLIRKRHTLPEAPAKRIEKMRKTIGEVMGGEQGAIVLLLLDTPGLPEPDWRVEAMLAANEAWVAANAQPAPHRPEIKQAAKHGDRNWLH